MSWSAGHTSFAAAAWRRARATICASLDVALGPASPYPSLPVNADPPNPASSVVVAVVVAMVASPLLSISRT